MVRKNFKRLYVDDFGLQTYICHLEYFVFRLGLHIVTLVTRPLTHMPTPRLPTLGLVNSLTGQLTDDAGNRK